MQTRGCSSEDRTICVPSRRGSFSRLRRAWKASSSPRRPTADGVVAGRRMQKTGRVFCPLCLLCTTWQFAHPHPRESAREERDAASETSTGCWTKSLPETAGQVNSSRVSLLRRLRPYSHAQDPAPRTKSEGQGVMVPHPVVVCDLGQQGARPEGERCPPGPLAPRVND